jgi:hypothetical protein
LHMADPIVQNVLQDVGCILHFGVSLSMVNLQTGMVDRGRHTSNICVIEKVVGHLVARPITQRPYTPLMEGGCQSRSTLACVDAEACWHTSWRFYIPYWVTIATDPGLCLPSSELGSSWPLETLMSTCGPALCCAIVLSNRSQSPRRYTLTGPT